MHISCSPKGYSLPHPLYPDPGDGHSPGVAILDPGVASTRADHYFTKSMSFY